jgi:hypothetical protein
MFGNLDYTVYSFLELSGVIAHPLVGSCNFIGQGVGQITITLETDKTIHEHDINGTVLIGLIPGHNGKIIIQCQQTSNVHRWLLRAYSIIVSSLPSDWGTMIILLRNINNGMSHDLKGVSFDKIPELTYAADGSMINWSLSFAHATFFAPSVVGVGQI